MPGGAAVNWITREEADALPIILLTVAGSEVHGTALPGGGDIDHFGMAVDPRDSVLGLDSRAETWSYRSARARAKVEGTDLRSRPGDLDLLVHPLRKWARGAIAGNPQSLTPLFVADEHVVRITPAGEELRANRHRFISHRVGRRHLGYMNSQRARLSGELSMTVVRPELIEAHGYDTKFAAHMLRLGYQGVAVYLTGEIPMPLPEDKASYIRDVRRGLHSLDAVLAEAHEIEKELVALLDTRYLPEDADVAWVNGWLARTLTEAYAAA